MHESPSSLQACCIDYICSNLQAVTTLQEVDDETRVAFANPEVYFHDVISDQIIAGLSNRGKLNNMSIQIFDPKVTRLKRVRLEQHARQTARDWLTATGLLILKEHSIRELEAVGFTEISITDFIHCLNKASIENMRILNFCRTTFKLNQGFPTLAIAQMKQLKTLNLGFTSLKDIGLMNMMSGLSSLENLDISCTEVSDITPLRSHRDKLKQLSLYNLVPVNEERFASVIQDLKYLRFLDVSVDIGVNPLDTLLGQDSNAFKILEVADTLEHLTSLDLSGRVIGKKAVLAFLEKHSQLQFLGLLHTECSSLDMFTDKENPDYRPELKTTGETTEEQVLESLKRYVQRSTYIRKALYHLFSLTQNLADPRLDMIKLVLPPMRCHPKELQLQMAATACLFNLTRSEFGKLIHPSWLSQVVELTLDAMENHKSATQLQKNALLTLCSDRILQDVKFDQCRCARLVMECLCSFSEGSMGRMAVAICSILAAKIPTEETSKLGSNPEYMGKLLSIVKEKTEAVSVDITMKFTLSALWNLTDESPSTCSMFLSKKGLEMFIEALKVFRNGDPNIQNQVETKVLGLINNLAEVKHLRRHLMKENVLDIIRELLASDKIDVSYFAAGILAHLASDSDLDWQHSPVPFQIIVTALSEQVKKWEQPDAEMVAYRSFKPFFSLLEGCDVEAVQLWAVWAIQHVCTRNGPKYCGMLEEEGGVAILQGIARRQRDPYVLTLVHNVLQLCRQYNR